MPEPRRSRTAEIRAIATQDVRGAEARIESLIVELFAIPVRDLRINEDPYSLNSLNGFFASGDEEFFFKFHQEDGEEHMRGEYYRAGILAHAGLPVDQPVHISAIAGEQLLVYRRRADPRFSDVLFELDQTQAAASMARAIAAEAALNDHLIACARDTLHPITPEAAAAEPIHRLFHERLIDQETKNFPGGRYARFYTGRRFEFPNGVSVDWNDLQAARPVINGIEYRLSFGEAFRQAHLRYAPERLADAGGIVAHGDAHNANIWYERHDVIDRLAFFDPAFAGDHVPSLLAEVKATFHNIFAHPYWLYNPELAAGHFTASVRLDGHRLLIDTDWRLTRLREALLQTKARHYWKPWLATLSARQMLPDDWEDVIRLGLFLSPTLVMNLRAGEGADRHNPVSSAIGLAIALACASRPVFGRDMLADFFASITPR
jgi:hypothetical protein